MNLHGVLPIDKPAGLTSHDVVAAARRVLGEKRIGHTGTLDPMATGVLPLVCGRATRLVRFLTASDKEYEAEIRLGVATDTYDITGRETSRSAVRPGPEEIVRALQGLTGEYLQSPPPFSAKKVGGQRAYELARAEVSVQPAPVLVRAHRIDVLDVADDGVIVRLTCSAGFYVRSLAHELGARLGAGGCLAALRRTRSGTFQLSAAVPLDRLSADPAGASRTLVPLAALLPELPAVVLTDEGARRVAVGRSVGPAQMTAAALPAEAPWVRLLSASGELLAMAEPAESGASLHPSVVLH